MHRKGVKCEKKEIVSKGKNKGYHTYKEYL